jgi:hypothetical protein
MALAITAVNLRAVGVSEAKGPQLVAARDQPNANASPGADKTDNGTATAPARKSEVKELTPDQQRQVEKLSKIDREVRAHERAHMSAGSGLITNAASYTYTYGPDGKQYAVGGEVGIDTSAASKPEASIAKGRQIQAAALAPADPSAQDYRVASIGAQLELQGRSELSEQQAQQRSDQVAQDIDRHDHPKEASTQRREVSALYAQHAGEAKNIEPGGTRPDGAVRRINEIA